MERYVHKEIEQKWQSQWKADGLYDVENSVTGKENEYLLVEFPYPSGNLHVGHWYAFGVPDIYARFRRMQGRNVLFPIGFDAFGLPAENAAIKNDLNPRTWTEKNMEHMRTQIASMGASYDTSREVVTCDRAYYKWTQWLFIQLFNAGLVEQRDTRVNWCPRDQTVLANEQVVNGRCERCDSQVEKKKMKQWNIKITDYADRLIDDLENLDWPEEIKHSQRNWIGRSEGAEINFEVSNQQQTGRVVLMHGKDTDPSQKWYPWLAQKMKNRSIDFDAPTLPRAEDPKLDEWLEELERTNPDESTVLVGHSRGSVAILRWLEDLEEGKKVKKVILVAANFAKFDKKHTEENTGGFYTKKGYDFEKIKNHCDEFVVLHSRDDEWVPFANGEKNAQGLGAKFLTFDDRGHFGTKLSKQEIPELFDEVLRGKKQQILLATNNESKKARVEGLFAKNNYDVEVLSPSDLGIDPVDVEEDGTLEENAIKKAKAYFGKTDLPIIANDTSFFLDGENLDPVKVKRNALDGKDESEFTQEEISQKIYNFYKEIAKKKGGEVDGYWYEIWSMVLPDGIVVTEDSKREVVLTDQKKGEVDLYFPMRSLYYSKATGKNHNDSSEEEYLLEMQPVFNALKNLVDYSLGKEKIKVFTTRPDTLFGTTYMVLAPEHELIEKLKGQISNFSEVQKYVKQAQKKSEIERTNDTKEKTGVKLDGVSAINPANDEEIPIYVADYVLGGYGTGAIMAVPAHDERDYQFAQKYDIEIRQVIVPCFVDPINPPQENFKEVRRNTVITFLRDNATDKYALLDWHGTLEGITTTIMGGIDDGETPQEAALKEIGEESAVENARLVKEMKWITDAKYCASHKKQNRYAVAHASLYEVDDLSVQGSIDSAEQKIHTLRWVDEKQVEEALTPEHQKFIWQHIQNDKAIVGNGRLIDSGEFDGMESEEAKGKITAKVGGKMTKTYKLRDWTVSRQRYWGVPIPMIHCDNEQCGAVPVADADLPVELPEVEDYLPSGDGRSPLARVEEFVNVACPSCGKDAKRETDTFDTFVDSSWYFLRYADPKNAEAFADAEKLKQWLPVDLYSGGAEHTTMHLLYSRFFHKALFDLNLVNEAEPYKRRMNRGLILGPDGNKMSKSKGNVIDPDDIVHELGADTMRLYLAFIGPYNEVGSYPWNPESIVGVRRFLERVWKLQEKIGEGVVTEDQNIDQALHKALKQVTESIDGLKMNTGVAALMTCVNVLEKSDGFTKEQFSLFAQMLSPYAPHMAEELWREILQHKESIHLSQWPAVDEALLVSKEINLIVQVNGKVRDKITASADINEEDAKEVALASEKVQKFLDNKEPKKVIYVPGRLINIVV